MHNQLTKIKNVTAAILGGIALSTTVIAAAPRIIQDASFVYTANERGRSISILAV